MSALICGSLAYDTIMVFQDQFKNHILPDKVHVLNVSFLVPRMRKEFGGCAGNIAYVKGAPYTLPVRRLDDVRAARQLDIPWTGANGWCPS